MRKHHMGRAQGSSNLLWQWLLTDEARSPPDVSSFSASPPRSCFFLSFSGPCHSYDLCELAQTSGVWFRLWFPMSCATRAEIQKGGLLAGHPPPQLLKAGALYRHPGTPGLWHHCQSLDKYGMHVSSWKVSPCLSLLSHPHSESEDKDPQLPPERTERGVCFLVWQPEAQHYRCLF